MRSGPAMLITESYGDEAIGPSRGLFPGGCRSSYGFTFPVSKVCQWKFVFVVEFLTFKVTRKKHSI